MLRRRTPHATASPGLVRCPTATVRTGALHAAPIVAAVALLAACSALPPRVPQPPRGQAAPLPPARRRAQSQGVAQPSRSSPLAATKLGTAGESVALLLPLSGPAAHAAAAVRDGFMAAYYVGAPATRPRIRLYDTGAMGLALAVQLATRNGANFIVGPLTRTAVAAAADLDATHPPMLALNFLPVGQVAPSGMYQFALSPEEEARQVARRIVADGHRQGIAIVPRGDWGNRVLAAFKQALAADGATLLATARFGPGHADLAPAIQSILGITASWERLHALESILGRMHFAPRRRRDIDFIFEASDSAATARLMRGEIRFYYAGSVPAYATPEAFEPNPVANQELEGLEFPDMPWMLGGEPAGAVHAAAARAWPVKGPRFGRLFAFGFDAYRLLEALSAGSPEETISIAGLTGTLTLDPQGRVHRKLEWAQIRAGDPHLLPPPETDEAPSGPAATAQSAPIAATPGAPPPPRLRPGAPAAGVPQQ